MYKNKEHLVWGVQLNDPDYFEQIILVSKNPINLSKKLILDAKNKGFNRLRISEFNPLEKPNFTKTAKNVQSNTKAKASQ